jgi:hypothetical protein
MHFVANFNANPEKGKSKNLMTRNQQIGAWMFTSLLLALALYRWFNLQ